jgi:hypothetical protein
MREMRDWIRWWLWDLRLRVANRRSDDGVACRREPAAC